LSGTGVGLSYSAEVHDVFSIGFLACVNAVV
jgi:hypothetical protein